MSDALGRIQEISQAESLAIEQSGLETVFTICEGDMRKTVNMLQALALQNLHNVTLDSNYVYQMTGNLRPQQIQEIFTALTTMDLPQGYQYLCAL